MKCCKLTFGASSDWDGADEIGFAWWSNRWHDHRAHGWIYEIEVVVSDTKQVQQEK